jgi:hypothetical protein
VPRFLAHDQVLPGPLRDAQDLFISAFKASGVQPDISQSLAWDPAFIVVNALQHVGADATADRVRCEIASGHGYAGINGVYDFRDGSQRGITANAAVVVNGIPIVIRGPASAERAVTRENRSCLSPNACSAPERGRHRLEGRHLSRSCQERGDGVYSRQVKGFTASEWLPVDPRHGH